MRRSRGPRSPVVDPAGLGDSDGLGELGAVRIATADDMDHLHGEWLYACGHPAFQCKCVGHGGDKPFYRTDLCRECRDRVTPPTTQAEARDRVTEPFPKATD